MKWFNRYLETSGASLASSLSLEYKRVLEIGDLILMTNTTILVLDGMNGCWSDGSEVIRLIERG